MKGKKNTIIVLPCPGQSEGLWLAFRHPGSIFIDVYCQAKLLPTWLIETEVAVMICLGQGGLCSMSAFSGVKCDALHFNSA